MELTSPGPGATAEGSSARLQLGRRAKLLCDAAVIAQHDLAAEAARKVVILWDEAGAADVRRNPPK